MTMLSDVAILVYNQRSEREVLQEQLRHWDNMSKQLENVRATIKRRLAEIERETVERERSILIDSQVEYQA